MTDIWLQLPVPPPVNTMYRSVRGRVLKSKECRQYQKAVAYICSVNRIKPLEGDVAVSLHWYRQAKRGDLDGRIKVVLDALQGWAYRDDAQIAELTARRSEDPKCPRLVVGVRGVYE